MTEQEVYTKIKPLLDGLTEGLYWDFKKTLTDTADIIKDILAFSNSDYSGDNRVFPKYLFYILQREAPTYVNKGMGNPKLMSNVMEKISVPIPSLARQKNIVSVLERFEAICKDLTSGLPAEIAARQKQYEYYRDKLLTFKELDT